MSELYEKLYQENKRLKDAEYKRKRYLDYWKDRFGYSRDVSFDKVLEDLFKIQKLHRTTATSENTTQHQPKETPCRYQN